MSIPAVAALAYRCPNKAHATAPPRCSPYFREPDGKGSVVALYVCFDCRGGWVVKWYGPDTEEQAEANKALLHQEAGEWQASRRAAARAAVTMAVLPGNNGGIA